MQLFNQLVYQFWRDHVRNQLMYTQQYFASLFKKGTMAKKTKKKTCSADLSKSNISRSRMFEN